MRLVPRSDLATCGILGILEKRCFTWLVATPLSIALCAYLLRRDAAPARLSSRRIGEHNLDAFSSARRSVRCPTAAARSAHWRGARWKGPGTRRQVDLAPCAAL